jgi:hypothetical protein
MDISVSRLNERMALRVPSELPLGLVFIVGQIEEMRPFLPNPQEVSLQLVEGDHSLPCRLPRQVAEEMQLAGIERVRAGGHLVFDTRQARYYLRARDIEVLPSIQAPDSHSLPPETRRFLAEIEQRDREVRLVPAELPPWVRQLAPPEIQAELGLVEPEATAVREPAPPQPDPDLPLIPQEILDFLSAAIDSEEDIELTPDVMGGFATKPDEQQAAALAPSSYDVTGLTAPSRVAASGAAAQPGPQPFGLSSRQLTLIVAASLLGFLLLVLIVLIVLALSTGYPLPLPS